MAERGVGHEAMKGRASRSSTIIVNAKRPLMPHASRLMPPSRLMPCYHRVMPLIRCPKCGQAYDIPGVIAVRLPNSIATCHCGEWLSGSKGAILARVLDPSKIKEVDLRSEERRV